MSGSAVELRVGGRRYGGWKRVNLQHSIDTIASTFRVQVSERWPGQPTAREIRMGDAVEVLIDGEVALTGFVDDESIRVSKTAHEVALAGRHATGDLVDCSAVHEPGEWNGRTPEQIATDLCQPFGIDVIVAAPTGGPLEYFKVEEGEAVFSALERMARMRGFLLQDLPGSKSLLIAAVGVGRSTEALREGASNVLAWGLEGSQRDRFSEYSVKGQRRGNDDLFGEAAAEISAESKDVGVGRYRPLALIAEDQADLGTAQRRANWEASSRAGRARTPDVVVQGLRDAGGQLWKPNHLVRLESESLHVRRELLIASVSRTIDERGTRTALRLMRPEAFAPEPLPEQTQEEELWTD